MSLPGQYPLRHGTLTSRLEILVLTSKARRTHPHSINYNYVTIYTMLVDMTVWYYYDMICAGVVRIP